VEFHYCCNKPVSAAILRGRPDEIVTAFIKTADTMVRLFAIVLAIAAVHSVAAAKCVTVDLQPDAGMCSGKQLSRRACAESDSTVVMLGATGPVAIRAAMNALTPEKYAENGNDCPSKALRTQFMCGLVQAGTNGTDACGAVACWSRAECNTGLNPPSS
jgi:hypothetical protein